MYPVTFLDKPEMHINYLQQCLRRKIATSNTKFIRLKGLNSLKHDVELSKCLFPVTLSSQLAIEVHIFSMVRHLSHAASPRIRSYE